MTRTPPTVAILAKLSDDVYNTDGKGDVGSGLYKLIKITPPLTPPAAGSTPSDNSTPIVVIPIPKLLQTKSGVFEGDGKFKANVYKDSDSNEIVISVRGTNPSDGLIYNLLADGSFAPQGGVANALLVSYSTYLADIVGQVHASFPSTSISLTGHSMGGSIVQLVGKATGIGVTSFDAPGAANTLTAIETKVPYLGALKNMHISTPSSNITNYRLAGDMVSLIGKLPSGTNDSQLGGTITVANPGAVNLHSDKLVPIVASYSDVKVNHGITTLANQIQSLCPNGVGISCIDGYTSQKDSLGVLIKGLSSACNVVFDGIAIARNPLLGLAGGPFQCTGKFVSVIATIANAIDPAPGCVFR